MIVFWLLPMIEAEVSAMAFKTFFIDTCHLNGLLGFDQCIFQEILVLDIFLQARGVTC